MTNQTCIDFTSVCKSHLEFESAKDQLALTHLAQKFEFNDVNITKRKSKFLANLSADFLI
jgi:hypothetical protein